jgi:hypothetical protein
MHAKLIPSYDLDRVAQMGTRSHGEALEFQCGEAKWLLVPA